jgi:soluble lytic murein transglycosylase
VAIIRTESAFDTHAVSGMGAMGLMQMMPTTGTVVARERGTPLRHLRTLFDAELNIELGTTYLAALLREFGTTEDALVAYNAGPRVAHWMRKNPAARARFVAGYPRDVLFEWRRLLGNRPEEQLEPLPEAARPWVAESRLTAPR